MRITKLALLNLFIQMFFIRICYKTMCNNKRNYGIIYFVYPFTGWITDFKYPGRKARFKFFN